MFQAHGARRMRLLLVAEDNARILVTTFFIILLLRAMGGSPIVLVFPVSQICDLTPSLCACRDDCQSGVWRKQYKPTYVGTNVWFIRSEEHTSELKSLMRISYAVLCLKTK